MPVHIFCGLRKSVSTCTPIVIVSDLFAIFNCSNNIVVRAIIALAQVRNFRMLRSI